jgi:ketosteroid isomerase-like protein
MWRYRSASANCQRGLIHWAPGPSWCPNPSRSAPIRPYLPGPKCAAIPHHKRRSAEISAKFRLACEASALPLSYAPCAAILEPPIAPGGAAGYFADVTGEHRASPARLCRFNDAYEKRDISSLESLAEEMWHPDIVLAFQGPTFIEVGEWHGHEGLLRFTRDQTDGFEQMWLETDEFIDAGDRLIVEVRWGGRARHTGLPVEFDAVHVWTMRDGKATRFDIYETREEALEAVGLTE